MGVKMNNALAVEDFQQTFHCQIARRHLLFVAVSLPNPVAVILRLDEFFAHQSGRFAARAWVGTARRAERVCAVCHLHAAEKIALRVFDRQIINRFAVAVF